MESYPTVILQYVRIRAIMYTTKNEEDNTMKKNAFGYANGDWEKGEYKGYRFWVKHYDEPNAEFGWNGSRISKLMVKDAKGNITFNYDRGLDIDAQDKGTIKVLDYLMTIFG